jgi:disulfide oxidoreductase YuzD
VRFEGRVQGPAAECSGRSGYERWTILIEVKVYGSEPPCAKCKQAEGEARKAAEKFPGQVSVAKYSALLPEALQLGLLMTPAVVVDGKMISQGRVPNESELERILRSKLGG